MRNFDAIITKTARVPIMDGSVAMSGKKYWVVGGEYANSNFDSLKEGTGIVAGPYYLKDDALAEWKRLSEAAGSAMMRYSIAEEQVAV